MRIIRTNESRPNDILSQEERDWVYNGLDCAITKEVFEVIHPQLDEHTSETYDLSRSLQGPALEMRLRGVLVDQHRKAEVIDEFHEKLDLLDEQLTRIVLDGVGMTRFNWRSNDDLKMLFYNKLGIPEIKARGRVTVDRKALEKLEIYLISRQIVAHILKMRDLAKKISVLRTEIDPDGRMRTSYNIAGTETGRFSSSFSEFGTGGNLQNVEESLRSIFVSDPGYKFCKLDAKSGESYVVGGIEWNLFKDGRYLDAVNSGDIHTAVARICWPSLPWTGVLNKDKDIAEQPYYRHYTYRFMCKKLGHGSNYDGMPATLAAQTKLPESVVADFQPKYFGAFPSHLEWHTYVARELRSRGFLITLAGRKRWFLGRRNDPATLREAIAYDPQGSLADIVNRGMLRCWRERRAILMMHDHDATTWMYPAEQEDEVVPWLKANLVWEIPLAHGRTLAIPYDFKVGFNKGDWDEKTNPDGLKDYVGTDKRTRTPQIGLLDRVFHRKHRAVG
jgi:DNA polymerase I-like protein with 3'-5' exonuclease and polymerase domains